MQYYSEEEYGSVARDKNEISKDVWRAIAFEVRSRLDKDWFAWHFPQKCDDGPIYGTNLDDLADKLRGQIPAIAVPLDEFLDAATPPERGEIFELIQFCFRYFVEVAQRSYEYICAHTHLSFVQKVGQIGFREEIETILRRNSLAFTFTPEGQVKRVVSDELAQLMRTSIAPSGDSTMDRLLAEAREKVLEPDPVARRDALMDIWGAWERLKTLYGSGDKKAKTTFMLDVAAGNSSSKLRQYLESDAQQLTKIGNDLFIRHTETDQEELTDEAHIDYLFHRLYAMVDLVLRATRDMKPHPDEDAV